jgi:glucose-1-phosphate cytidylyltransferase
VKAVILAGGFGTRISEESYLKPKPMIEIGGMPIIWHIMKIYSAHGINDFVVCLGYKGYVIKEYFANHFLHMSDVTIDMANNSIEVHRRNAIPWKVTLVDTGEATLTAGRLKQVGPYLGDEEFCFTYGDGLANINVRELIGYHREQGVKATLTAVLPPGRFGALGIEQQLITHFQEKPRGDGAWVNGGFFVCQPSVLDYIEGDGATMAWEQEPLEGLARDRSLAAYFHRGFWQPMDTLRDKQQLEELWAGGAPPWKVWQ